MIEKNRDEEHLRLLSIFHYVVAALAGLFGCVFILYLVLGVFLLKAPMQSGEAPPPEFVGYMFIGMGIAFILMGWLLAAALFFAGRYISQRRNHMFCVVVAATSCLFMPVGTILGVFTLVVLTKPSVKELFSSPAG